MPIRPEVTKRYDLADPDVMYIGEAPYGSQDSQAVWTIRRIMLVAGNPTEEMVTSENSAVWDNRTTETYG